MPLNGYMLTKSCVSVYVHVCVSLGGCYNNGAKSLLKDPSIHSLKIFKLLSSTIYTTPSISTSNLLSARVISLNMANTDVFTYFA